MKTNKGFTLVEILVVVLIIGILSAIAVPQYNRSVKKSRAMQQVILLKSARESLDAFYLVHREDATPTREDLEIELPPNTDDLDIQVIKNSDGVRVAAREKKNGGDDFVIRYFRTSPRFPEYTGRIVCTGQNSTGDKICQDIGGTDGHKYKFIPSQNAWYLN
ncbi:MAG: type II secretion system protein [Elusimicrobiaceae bacterium]|nr:type II secretion system protein [Elusimicrobiaceae bacterium]